MKEVLNMIALTDLNKREFFINPTHIETINIIPETKVALTNGNFYLVSETPDQVINKIIDFNREIFYKSIIK